MRDERLAQAELAEHVDDGLHRRLVGDGDGRHVQDAVQLQRRQPARAARRRARWRPAREQHQGLARDAFYQPPRVCCVQIILIQITTTVTYLMSCPLFLTILGDMISNMSCRGKDEKLL